MPLQDSFILFRRLGVDVTSLTPPEFRAAYVTLARRYHPDNGEQPSHALMANINAARQTIQQTFRHP